jgi:hypothetical protein
MTAHNIVDQETNNQVDEYSDIKIIGYSSLTTVALALFYDFNLAKAAGQGRLRFTGSSLRQCQVFNN